MREYLIRRIALSLLTFWLLTVGVFVLLRVAPGDAVLAAMAQSPGEGSLNAEQIAERRHALGLDRTYPAQYADWLGDIVRLDAGRSLTSGARVLDETLPRFAVTAELTLITAAIVAVAGPALGLVAAQQRGRWPDIASRAMTLLSLSTPAFWLGLLVIVAAAAWAGRFIAGEYTHLWNEPWRNVGHVLPAAIVLALRPAAVLGRVVRTGAIETLSADFVRSARARGLPERAVLWRHAFRASLLPALTVFGTQVVYLLGGAVVIEQVFGLPGIGRALVAGVTGRDYTTVQFLVLAFGAITLAANLAVDILYVRLDPRVRLT